jgi:hypothetical protein
MFRIPNVKPATNGIDHWTLIFVEIDTRTADQYRMPVAPDEPCDEPPEHGE